MSRLKKELHKEDENVNRLSSKPREGTDTGIARGPNVSPLQKTRCGSVDWINLAEYKVQ